MNAYGRQATAFRQMKRTVVFLLALCAPDRDSLTFYSE
jgi:hypothetical protein